MSETVSRRARLRAETSAEIKTIALKLMATGGPDAISLRAIAREMGMTAGAIYSYYPTRDDLITTLISDVYGELVDAVEAARDAVPESDPAGRLLAWGENVRTWALANPEGFRLIYGDPVPGYRPPEGGPAREAAHRACAGLSGLVAAAWPQAESLQSGTYDWSDFETGLAEATQEQFPGLPPAAVALSLRVWGRMHGLIALEIYGHLRPLTHKTAAIFRDEMLDLTRSLGLTPSESHVR
ncbi:TetR/AcrR family transcriptional regulator [Actinomadura rudentiformis]|uniref:TetR/AcrR family transcriptional regulator n=1 Tax=Actinomadura rudentiformis TaxID=359158 RepID=A0A6H9Z1I0_9ACTN|nr:TetR/AcrR family transcriptional regulator [Actinomadura rudentiformis]KAB2351655.1 TetR/AcrR family transcriptional regulator [Actinomadura rudentiformis]